MRKKIVRLLPWILTPIFLLLLSGGMTLLAYTLAPSHQLQNYLNIAFMDNQKITSTTAGLNIVQKEISTATERPTSDTGTVQYPKFGEQYAMLECKEIDLTVGVYFGATSELLALGACQSTQSTVLGDVGNVVIDAHVNTFFANLSKMEVGDTVTLYTDYGKFTYRAAEAIRFAKTNKKYVVATETDYLTLYTCEAQVMGNSDMRVGMRCELVSKEFYTDAVTAD